MERHPDLLLIFACVFVEPRAYKIINLSLGTKTPNDSNFEGVKHHLNYCKLEVIFQSLRCAKFVAKGQV